MSKQTCEIDGKIFEGIPINPDTCAPCRGCAGYRIPDVCIQLDDCLNPSIIWVAVE